MEMGSLLKSTVGLVVQNSINGQTLIYMTFVSFLGENYAAAFQLNTRLLWEQ